MNFKIYITIPSILLWKTISTLTCISMIAVIGKMEEIEMSESYWNLEASEEEGQRQALREAQQEENWHEERYQKKIIPKCLNCDDKMQRTKEVKCQHCGAQPTHDAED